MLRTTIIILSLMMVIAGISCTIVSHQATPAEVDRNALRYAVDAGVTDFNDYDAWYPNLAEAIRLIEDVDAAYSVKQLKIQQVAEKNDLDYSIHTKTTRNNFRIAQQREEALFGGKGLLSMGLGLLGMGSLTGMLGLMRKRPGDISKPEMEQALASATGKTSAELSIQQKQFVQLVRGVQAFMNSGTPTQYISQLKIDMNQAQDKDTQAAVAVIKKLV